MVKSGFKMYTGITCRYVNNPHANEKIEHLCRSVSDMDESIAIDACVQRNKRKHAAGGKNRHVKMDAAML
uniref:SFRICE_004912 n=1 Tax=Spodoptera frugiperda TaxID=7108 RepID=A0A2H1VTA7_SPOFR